MAAINNRSMFSLKGGPGALRRLPLSSSSSSSSTCQQKRVRTSYHDGLAAIPDDIIVNVFMMAGPQVAAGFKRVSRRYQILSKDYFTDCENIFRNFNGLCLHSKIAVWKEVEKEALGFKDLEFASAFHKIDSIQIALKRQITRQVSTRISMDGAIIEEGFRGFRDMHALDSQGFIRRLLIDGKVEVIYNELIIWVCAAEKVIFKGIRNGTVIVFSQKALTLVHLQNVATSQRLPVPAEFPKLELGKSIMDCQDGYIVAGLTMLEGERRQALAFSYNMTNRETEMNELPSPVIFTCIHNKVAYFLCEGKTLFVKPFHKPTLEKTYLLAFKDHPIFFQIHGDNLILGYKNGLVQTWNFKSSTLEKEIHCAKEVLAYDLNGCYLSLTTAATVELWDIHTVRPIFQTECAPMFREAPLGTRSIFFDPYPSPRIIHTAGNCVEIINF